MPFVRKYLPLFLLLIAPAAQGQTIAASAAVRIPVEHDRRMLVRTAASEALLEEGRRAIADFRIRDAERAFTRLANLPDGRPAGLYNLTFAAFLTYLVSDRPEDLDLFELRSHELKQELDDLPDSPWRALLGAETNLQRAVVRAKTGRYVRAALAARTAYHEFERIVREYPELDDAHKGYGALKVAIGSLPATYQRFLSLVGFQGSVQDGVNSLNRAIESSSFSADEATIVLAIVHTVLLEPSDGATLMQRMAAKYPESVLVNHVSGYVLLESRRARDAERAFEKAIANGDGPGAQSIDYSTYFLGLARFRLNDFNGAVTALSDYLVMHDAPALRASSELVMGVSLEMLGDRSAAVDHYRRVEVAREFDLDAVSRRRAERLSLHPMDATERELQLGANDFDAGNYEEAIVRLVHVSQEASATDDQIAEAHYRLGRAFQVTARLEDALKNYAAAISRTTDPMSRWAPWSEYYSGRIHEAAGRRAEAIDAYRRALDYSGSYDYYQSLEQNVRLALVRLK